MRLSLVEGYFSDSPNLQTTTLPPSMHSWPLRVCLSTCHRKTQEGSLSWGAQHDSLVRDLLGAHKQGASEEAGPGAQEGHVHHLLGLTVRQTEQVLLPGTAATGLGRGHQEPGEDLQASPSAWLDLSGMGVGGAGRPVAQELHTHALGSCLLHLVDQAPLGSTFPC